MRLRTREREEPDIIITPLIDVVFLLLIFFYGVDYLSTRLGVDHRAPGGQ